VDGVAGSLRSHSPTRRLAWAVFEAANALAAFYANTDRGSVVEEQKYPVTNLCKTLLDHALGHQLKSKFGGADIVEQNETCVQPYDNAHGNRKFHSVVGTVVGD